MTESALILAAVWKWFPPRRWAVCDGVSYGWGLLYEADAIAVSKAGRVHELEAKSAKADLARDHKKRKWLLPAQVDYFWYVVPTALTDPAVALARPRGLGVISVSAPGANDVIGNSVRLLLPKPLRSQNRVRDRSDRPRLWRLAAVRYWDERIRKPKGETR